MPTMNCQKIAECKKAIPIPQGHSPSQESLHSSRDTSIGDLPSKNHGAV